MGLAGGGRRFSWVGLAGPLLLASSAEAQVEFRSRHDVPIPPVPRHGRSVRPAGRDSFAKAAALPPAWSLVAAPPPLPVRLELGSPDADLFLEAYARSTDFLVRLPRPDGTEAVAEAGNALLRGPESLLDGVLGWVGDALGSPGEADSMLRQGLDLRVEGPPGALFSRFLERWLKEERSALEARQDARSDPGFDGDVVAEREFEGAQRRILWDAAKSAYLSKFQSGSGDRFGDDAFRIADWRGIDVAVLPPLLGAYLYFHGIDRRMSLGDSSLRVVLEPFSDLLGGRGDRSTVSALEWRPKGFPLGLIVSMGQHDGRYGMEFVGIGTSLEAVRGSLAILDGEPRR